MRTIGRKRTVADHSEAGLTRSKLDERDELSRLPLLAGRFIDIDSLGTNHGGHGQCADMDSASRSSRAREYFCCYWRLVYLGLSY